jgi:hypothetical protein
MILKFLKIIVIFLLRIYSKRTGKTHQSLVISTLEYIPKEKGGKRQFQKNMREFLKGVKVHSK